MSKTIYINEIMEGNRVIVGGDEVQLVSFMKSPEEDVKINICGMIFSLKHCYEQYHDAIKELEEIRKNDSEEESERKLDVRIAKDIVADLKNKLCRQNSNVCSINKKIQDIMNRENKPISKIFQLAGEDWEMFEAIKTAIGKINTLEMKLSKKSKKGSKNV